MPSSKESRRSLRPLWIALAAVFGTLLLLLILAGTVYWGFTHMNDKSAAEIHQAETATTIAIKNHFADIKTVEFHGTSYNAMTGVYALDVTMTNSESVSMRFITEHLPSRPNAIGGWKNDEDKEQHEGKTATPVRVTYSDGSQGKI